MHGAGVGAPRRDRHRPQPGLGVRAGPRRDGAGAALCCVCEEPTGPYGWKARWLPQRRAWSPRARAAALNVAAVHREAGRRRPGCGAPGAVRSSRTAVPPAVAGAYGPPRPGCPPSAAPEPAGGAAGAGDYAVQGGQGRSSSPVPSNRRWNRCMRPAACLAAPYAFVATPIRRMASSSTRASVKAGRAGRAGRRPRPSGAAGRGWRPGRGRPPLRGTARRRPCRRFIPGRPPAGPPPGPTRRPR